MIRWLGALLLACACACSSTPEVTGSPWTFVPMKTTHKLDKVDILFAIDNSASMGDKQALLAAAIPSFVGRLVNPNCVDALSNACTTASDCTTLGPNADCDPNARAGQGQCFVPGDGKGTLQCTTVGGTKPEFPPVHDLHIGIVSSSLGGGGSPDLCVLAGTNDQGHLLNRGPVTHAQPVDGKGGNFLAWLPANEPVNAGKSPPNVTPYTDGQSTPLISDFQSLVVGVDQHGCGLEAQLESWYRFLVQPDPYDQIVMSTNNPPSASYQGVDATLLAMRHDFLRPDSLVLIVQVTDEEDSWSDPLWLGGYGWTSRTANFPGGPGSGAGPRGTSECDADPNDPDCTSCAFPGSNKPVSGTAIGQDPNCNACPPGASTCPQNGWYVPASISTPIAAADGLNVRYASQTMRARYGFDNQHDVRRYIDGLRSATVPDRDNEAHPPFPYASTKRNCTNPLFAQDLPDGSDTSPGAICQLKAGSRTPEGVYYALLGGVPRSLVEDGNGLKLDLSTDDWTKIVGKDPEHYVFDGIDPHMVESTSPRAGMQTPDGTYTLGTDPENGRDWNTLTSVDGIDLEYACTFDLPKPKDCTDAANQGACDCAGAASSAADGPPVCSTTTRTTQVKGKAYPTIRELRVSQGLGAQSFVASLCANDYDPAMNGIVRRIDGALGGQCLGPTLSVNSCILLVTFPAETDQQSACSAHGLSQPPASALSAFRAQFLASLGDAGASQPVPALCVLQRLPTCDSDVTGWCYETNTDGCAHKIAFSAQSPPPGTTISLACTALTSN